MSDEKNTKRDNEKDEDVVAADNKVTPKDKKPFPEEKGEETGEQEKT